MKTKSNDILANIIKIRNDKGFTQAAIAEGIEVDYSTYSKLESGITKLSIDRLEKIASYFKMEIIDIITYPQKYVPAAPIEQQAASRTKVVVQLELDELQQKDVLNLILGEQKTALLMND